MIMISDAVRAFLQDNPVGVLGTRRADGTVRQSVVYYAVQGDRLLISTESKRAKARDVRRDRWASLCVAGTSAPYPSATLEGLARVVPTGISADTGAVWSRIPGMAGTEPPAEADLTAADRVIIEIIVDRVYGVSYIKADMGGGPP
jgi:PPOX class probable F420-dependent enzyme